MWKRNSVFKQRWKTVSVYKLSRVSVGCAEIYALAPPGNTGCQTTLHLIEYLRSSVRQSPHILSETTFVKYLSATLTGVAIFMFLTNNEPYVSFLPQN